VRRIVTGVALLVLGWLALATPFFAGKDAALVLGLLVLGSGLLQLRQAFAVRERHAGNAAFFSSAVSIAVGFLLLALPKLTFTGLTVLLGLSFLLDGFFKIVAAVRGGVSGGRSWALIDGLINGALGVSIAISWPLSGALALGVYVGIHILAASWSMLFGRPDAPAATTEEAAARHPDPRMHLPPHPELAKLRAMLAAQEEARHQTDRYWRLMFLLTFFAIHVGRMDASWNLVGLASPAVAVVGDMCFALLLAFGVILPVRLGWRALTRRWERRCWTTLLGRIDAGRGPGIRYGLIRRWLVGRMRFSLRVSQARHSPTGALGRGLQIGLPLTAILVALNPIWGFSWYFNTENWATGAWEMYVEHRTDAWREQMVQAVRVAYGDKGIPEEQLLQIAPEGVAGAGDFSFVVIGDPGEGDASQYVLCDQLWLLGQHPEVKFLFVASDVIYPSGEMKDYEAKFYLPFKGFTKPIYAIPGNHDWYDGLEGFSANFLEPDAARASLRARREADRRLTSTTERHIETIIAEAARLRREYGVSTGHQRAPYFEMQTEHFALIAVDTGVLRSVDAEQLRWFRAALKRSHGKFKMVIPGHPLFAGGRYQGEGDEAFNNLHLLLKEYEVDVAMAGDTHFLEHYREPYRAGDRDKTMYHFVNGGGGAYLSIGTALDWPKHPALADSAFYPRTDAIIHKLDRQTPAWKRPLWFWVKHLRAWPSTPEAVASAFDFNQAPFFQSFMEVRVERSANLVRLRPYGANGRLRWRDFQVHGAIVPDGEDGETFVEFRLPLSPANP
jgi:uncharacterized membrane protein HdeD (DUF308 family)